MTLAHFSVETGSGSRCKGSRCYRAAFTEASCEECAFEDAPPLIYTASSIGLELRILLDTLLNFRFFLKVNTGKIIISLENPE